MVVCGAKKSAIRMTKQVKFGQATMLDMGSRLRVARGIGADETQASIEVFQSLKERGHPDGPPLTISEG